MSVMDMAGTPIEVNDADRRAEGINLVLSAHAREAYLMDADGQVLHRWSHKGGPSSTGERYSSASG